MMSGPGRRSEEVGETIASFQSYEAAQKAVSALIAGEVPARQIAIVGMGLRSIERITGRLGYATAARSGAINGLLIGLFLSAILVLGSPSVPIQAFVGVLFVGIALGMLLSIITYSFVRRRRDYASVMQVVADHYDVTVDAASAGKARGILGHQTIVAAPVAPVGAVPVPTPGAPVPSPVAEPADIPDGEPGAVEPEPVAPPRYGERVPAAENSAATER